jgi:peptidoglycan hydrolase CwlO-like protein
MKKLEIKDIFIIVLASLLLIVICILIFTGGNKNEVLNLLIEQKEEQIKNLQYENDSLDQQNEINKYNAKRYLDKIDTLTRQIDNRKPIIKYIKEDLEDENNKNVITPDSTIIDSVFTSLLPN